MKGKRILIWVASLAAFLAPVAMAPPASAHAYDVVMTATCGMSGGAGTVRTWVYLDYSASKASVRVDKVRVANDTNRSLTIRGTLRVGGSYYQQFNQGIGPNSWLEDTTVLHESWIPNSYSVQYWQTYASWGDHRAAHYIHTDWSPVSECSTYQL